MDSVAHALILPWLDSAKSVPSGDAGSQRTSAQAALISMLAAESVAHAKRGGTRRCEFEGQEHQGCKRRRPADFS